MEEIRLMERIIGGTAKIKHSHRKLGNGEEKPLLPSRREETDGLVRFESTSPGEHDKSAKRRKGGSGDRVAS